MNDVKAFITAAATQLGTEEGRVRDATGGLLRILRERAAPEDAQGLMTSLPGAKELLENGHATALPTLKSGGLLGMVGGNASGAAGVLGVLAGAGIDSDKIVGFATMFTRFLTQNVNGDLARRVLEGLPELKNLVV